MPAPAAYSEGNLDSALPEQDPFITVPYQGVLYATDRAVSESASEDAGATKRYLDERGYVLRLGVAQVKVKDGKATWEEARRVSLLKERGEKYPISVSKVQEYGVLSSTVTPLLDDSLAPPDAGASQQRFAAAIDQQLSVSRASDVYVYIHGYKVNFDNPVLVATELWHFLGYSGAFVAYSWPSTPKTTAYIRDIDTAAGFARNFRLFLEFLAQHTTAEKIHIVGYSAGTRLVARAFEQMAMASQHLSDEEIRQRYRIGNLILVGSDVDRAVFGEYVADGLLRIPQHTSVYMSGQDKALGMSRFLTNRPRLGQHWDPARISSDARAFLASQPRLSLINVSAAEGADTGNGHSYFRSSPWVSSDILVQLGYQLLPGARGLAPQDDSPIWHFPDDYVERLRVALEANSQR
ncbi:MAG: alpha/beta hydrolase [Halioglobus sp.]